MTTVEMRGRSRKLSRSPDSTSQMRSTASTSLGQSTNVTCLDVSVSIVKYSTSSRRSSGTSVALTCVHMRSSSRQLVHEGGALAQVLEGAGPADARCGSPASWPRTRSGAKWNGSPSPSTTSSAGVAPAITNDRGLWAMAHSTSSRGRRAMPVASSTSAPRAASRGSTLEPAKRMPTVAEQIDRLVGDAALLLLGEPRRRRLHARTHLRGPKPSRSAAASRRPERRPRQPFDGHNGTIAARCQDCELLFLMDIVDIALCFST